jgi:hypothetical protein
MWRGVIPAMMLTDTPYYHTSKWPIQKILYLRYNNLSFVHYQIEKGRSAKLLCSGRKRDQRNCSFDPFQRGFCTESVTLLCDAVTGQEPSRAMLEALEHANLFVVSLATITCYIQGTKHELQQAVETTAWISRGGIQHAEQAHRFSRATSREQRASRHP